MSLDFVFEIADAQGNLFFVASEEPGDDGPRSFFCAAPETHRNGIQNEAGS
jgi:hypothetical protein